MKYTILDDNFNNFNREDKEKIKNILDTLMNRFKKEKKTIRVTKILKDKTGFRMFIFALGIKINHHYAFKERRMMVLPFKADNEFYVLYEIENWSDNKTHIIATEKYFYK